MVQLLGSSIRMNWVNLYFTVTKEEIYKSHKTKFEAEVSRSSHLHTHRVILILQALWVKRRGWSKLTAWRTVPAFVFGQFKIQPPNEKIPKSKHNIYIYIKYIDLPQLRGKTCNCRMEMLAPKLSHLVTYVCVCGCSTIDCVLSISLNFISYCILYSWLYIFNFFCGENP